MDLRQIQFSDNDETGIEEIEIPEKCKFEKKEISFSEIEETEIEQDESLDGEIAEETEIPEDGVATLEVESKETDAEQTEVPEESTGADTEQTEAPDSESIVIGDSDSGSDDSAEILSNICAQFEVMLERFDESQDAVTEFETPSGPIAVIHNITLGDLLISTLLVLILLFNVLNQLIRRF